MYTPSQPPPSPHRRQATRTCRAVQVDIIIVGYRIVALAAALLLVAAVAIAQAPMSMATSPLRGIARTLAPLHHDGASSGGPRAEHVTVEIHNANEFRAQVVTIAAGGSVTWFNDHSEDHTASGAGGIDSGRLHRDQRYSHTFNKPGTYDYVCAFHADMQGTVRVADASGTVPPPQDNDGGGQPPPSNGAEKVAVSIGANFNPRNVTVTAGSVVTWTNNDSRPHTATATGSFDSGMLGAGQSYSHAFDTPGRYDYVCLFHSDMSGTVSVTDASGHVPPPSPGGGGGTPPPSGGKTPSGGTGHAPGGGASGGAGGTGGGGAPAPRAKTYTVTMGSDSYSPSAVSARVGDTVVWRNSSSVPHTVTGGPLHSGMMMGGQSYTVVLRQQGTVHYKCDFHPGMVGTLKVGAAPAGTTLPPPSTDTGVSGAGGATPALAPNATTGGSSTDAAVGGAASPSAQSYTVNMTGSAFDPQVLHARVGDEVTWVNQDPVPHNVTGGPLDSGMLMAGDEFTTVLTDTGTIEYECTLHAGMTGTLEVAEALPGTEIPPASSSITSGQSSGDSSAGGHSTPSAHAEPGAQNHTVEIVDFLYDPDPLEVHVGDTVTFVNKDTAPHTATAEDESWDSGNLNQHDEWTLAPDETGKISYICIYHPAMAGTLIVKAKDAKIAPPADSASSGDSSGAVSSRQLAMTGSILFGLLVLLAGLQLRYRRLDNRWVLLPLRLLASGGLLVSGYLHIDLALSTGVDGRLFTLTQLFVVQAVTALLAGAMLLVADHWAVWMFGLVVAVASLLPLLASVYYPLPAMGIFPPIDEPYWYGEKLLSLVLVAVVPMLWVIRRIAPPRPRPARHAS